MDAAEGLPRDTFDVCVDLIRRMTAADGEGVYALPMIEKLYMEQVVFESPMFKKISIRASGSKDKAWPRIGQCHDFLADGQKLDRYGMIVGFGAHMPLFLKCHPPTKTKEEDEEECRASGKSYYGGSSWNWKQSCTTTKRQRSAAGDELRAVKHQKWQLWKETGTWPWWQAWHPSEALYYSPKNFIQSGVTERGMAYSGVAWRLTRAWYLDSGKEAELTAYERPWIEQYGELAHNRALLFTEPFYRKAMDNGHTAQDVLNNPEIAKIYEDMAEKTHQDLFNYDESR